MTDPVEVDPIDEDKTVKRDIQEIRPTDNLPDVDLAEPPKLTIGGVLDVIKKKGLVGAISDDAWGPHVHLIILLIIISLVAVSVGVIQFAVR